jgi:hypothetical protein
MSVAAAFAEQIEQALEELSTNEWALTEARERVLRGVTARQAFDDVVDVLRLSLLQEDSYAFASCCWLARSLAELSDTTQVPDGLDVVLSQVTRHAKQVGYTKDVEEIYRWYRHAV